MGITRLIILGLLIWIGFRLYKTIIQRKATKQTKHISGDLVQCAKCGTHIPKETASAKDNKFYCPPGNSDCQ